MREADDPHATGSHAKMPVRACWSAFFVTFAISAMFDHSRDWNTASRFLLTHALVDHGTVVVSQYVSAGGIILEHPPTRDLARSATGEFFCDKAPGLSVLGTIPYAIGRFVFGLGPARNETGRPEPSDYWVTLGTVGLVSACSAFWMVRLLTRWGVGSRSALVTALATSVGSMMQAYGTLYYGHAVAAGLLIVVLGLLAHRNPGPGRSLWAGLLSGAAVAVEYPAALVVGVFGVFLVGRALVDRRGPGTGTILSFALGVAIPIVPLGLYHQWVTGSPLRVPYTLEVEEAFAYHREGTGVPIGGPTAEAVWGMLVGPSRGLIWYAPMLLAALPGCFLMVRYGRGATLAVILLSAGGLFVAIAGFPTWHGGLATGPRLLGPIMPMAMLPAAFFWDAMERRRWWWFAALVLLISSGWIAMINAVGGRVPVGVRSIVGDYVRPALARGTVDGHLGRWILESLNVSDPTFGLVITIVVGMGLVGLGVALPVGIRSADRPE